MSEATIGSRVAGLLVRSWPSLVVLLFAAWLVWPVPRGVMPMSADHTVHLARIVLTAERLASTGALSGWEPTWFFGFPLGDLYPQLGDLLIIAIRALSLGLLDWPQAYALGFFVVFSLQGLVLVRLGRLTGMGPWPGLIAAALALADPGFSREGGWMYTVYFGVWPQALATSMIWLGFGELAVALGWTASRGLVDAEPAEPAEPPEPPLRPSLRASLAFAAGLLAHPIALPSLVIGAGIFSVVMIPRAVPPWREALARVTLVLALAGMLSAWWWVPMMEHKAWMASYGWLFASLDSMLDWLVEGGRWAQRMPAAVGYLAIAGMAAGALGLSARGWLRGGASAAGGRGELVRFVALFALIQWLLASSDAFWQLRLDRFSEGFAHLQWQRFLIAAKPGVHLCAGVAVVLPIAWARRLYLARGRAWWKLASAGVLACVGVAGTCWLVADQRAVMREFEVGAVQVDRMPDADDPAAFERDYQELVAWLQARWEERDHDYRVAVQEQRNRHWFMDAPLYTDTPIYKLGFTPGDNFVHKPEHGRRELLDALGVRWVIGRGRGGSSAVASFGSIYVREHRGEPRPLAWIEGAGRVELEEVDLRGGLVRARVSGTEAGSRVVFAIAGYPRWQLRVAGQPVEWFEVPVWGDGPSATLAERRGGALRGGKALGDDGSEPTLIAADLPAGLSGAELELVYVERTQREWLAELVSLSALIGVALAASRRRLRGWSERARGIGRTASRVLARLLHPIMLAVLVIAALAVAGQRWQDARAREATRLLGWVEAGSVERAGIEAGPVKSDMLIRPAVVLRPRPGKPASLRLELDAMPEQLRGWYGIDDDQAQQRGPWASHRLRVEARPREDEGPWSTLLDVQVRHAPQQVPIEIDADELAGRAVELRIIDEASGKRLPRLGLDLELEEQP